MWKLALPLLLISNLALAEYRVFLLEITTPSSDPTQAPEKRSLASTLDPVQYRGFYPLEPGQTIFYTDTWLCPGRTGGFKPLCPNPRAPADTSEGQDLN